MGIAPPIIMIVIVTLVTVTLKIKNAPSREQYRKKYQPETN